MKDNINILIKFNDEDLYVNNEKSTTMLEHLNIINQMGKVIWGQSSERIKKLASDKVNLINNEIATKGYIYIFFVASKNGNKSRKVYVGKCTRLFIKGEIDKNSNEFKYIPNYYSNVIGTNEDDVIALFEIEEFININEEDLNDIYLLSNKKQQVMEVKNMNSLFYTTSTNTLIQKILKKFNLKDKKKKEEILNDEYYQNDIEIICKTYSGKEKVKEKYITKSSAKFKRDAVRGRNAIISAKYKCEVDEGHEFFISSVTGKNYVEAHHLIPIEYSDLFNVNIDVEENIISLCVLCHKKLHHGTLNDIKPILTKLYNERKEGLERKGINITLDELIDFYI